MFHLIIVALMGLLLGATFQLLKFSPAAAVIAPIIEEEVSVWINLAKLKTESWEAIMNMNEVGIY